MRRTQILYVRMSGAGQRVSLSHTNVNTVHSLRAKTPLLTQIFSKKFTEVFVSFDPLDTHSICLSISIKTCIELVFFFSRHFILLFLVCKFNLFRQICNLSFAITHDLLSHIYKTYINLMQFSNKNYFKY